MTALMEKESLSKEQLARQHILQAVRCRLRECPYAIRFNNVVVEFEQGRLTLHGAVPSFYMKQMLQEILRGIQHVERIRNEVDVVHTQFLER